MNNYLRAFVCVQRMRLIPRYNMQTIYYTTKSENEENPKQNSKADKPLSPRMKEFQQKLREKAPIDQLDELQGKHPYQEKEPLKPWPQNKNPHTGEIGGPAGPEPTRYGDWERKGRVSDF